MKNYLLGCDWGTSSFRLRLIKLDTQQVIGEVTSQDGIAETFNAWKQLTNPHDITRRQFYGRYLEKQIKLISQKAAENLDHVPMVISGMASSSIGFEEIPYATLPFPLDGSQLALRHLKSQPDFQHDIFLVSGVQSLKDVMRGEETQLIGLISMLQQSNQEIDKATLIFPGTHSKHIFVENDKMVNFQTFMTGEVFNLMARHGILKDSLEVMAFADYQTTDFDAFKKGVAESKETNILNGLFLVRTNQLFNKLDKKRNALFLSGLLIGSELKHLLDKAVGQLILCSSKNLIEYYKLALQELQITKNTLVLEADLIDKATVFGQINIFQNQKIKAKSLS